MKDEMKIMLSELMDEIDANQSDFSSKNLPRGIKTLEEIALFNLNCAIDINSTDDRAKSKFFEAAIMSLVSAMVVVNGYEYKDIPKDGQPEISTNDEIVADEKIRTMKFGEKVEEVNEFTKETDRLAKELDQKMHVSKNSRRSIT